MEICQKRQRIEKECPHFVRKRNSPGNYIDVRDGTTIHYGNITFEDEVNPVHWQILQERAYRQKKNRET